MALGKNEMTLVSKSKCTIQDGTCGIGPSRWNDEELHSNFFNVQGLFCENSEILVAKKLEDASVVLQAHKETESTESYYGKKHYRSGKPPYELCAIHVQNFTTRKGPFEKRFPMMVICSQSAQPLQWLP